jgi:uncharacterized phage protein (TIGR01671 family)
MENRELKFRIWDTLAKKYISQRHYLSSMKVDDSGIATFTYKQYLDGGFIIQQFTGLKDKNSKEIFEGDIVSFDEPTKLCEDVYMATLYVFDFYNGSFLNPYIYNSINGSKFIKMEPSSLNPVGRARLEGNQKFDWTKAEIRGNVYENPELVDR